MPAVTVYIANLAHVNDGDINRMSTLLSNYFNRVVADTDSSFNGVRVVTTNRGLAVTNFDLFCYIVPNFAHGKVRLFDSNYRANATSAGNTSFFPPTFSVSAASEIYTDIIDLYAVDKGLAYANLIFHELMHNKAGMGSALHEYGGRGLADEFVRELSVFTYGNCTFMADRLGIERRQYVANF